MPMMRTKLKPVNAMYLVWTKLILAPPASNDLPPSPASNQNSRDQYLIPRRLLLLCPPTITWTHKSKSRKAQTKDLYSVCMQNTNASNLPGYMSTKNANQKTHLNNTHSMLRLHHALHDDVRRAAFEAKLLETPKACHLPHGARDVWNVGSCLGRPKTGRCCRPTFFQAGFAGFETRDGRPFWAQVSCVTMKGRVEPAPLPVT